MAREDLRFNNEEFNLILEKAKIDADAGLQFIVGLCYYLGEGINKDRKEAFKWFMKAAEQGLVDAQFKIGCCYYLGEGIKKDEKEAFKWFMEAAKQGNAVAQYNVGIDYYHGCIIEKDEKEAFKWFMKAAKQNHIDAQFMVGASYLFGRGVEEDEKEAFKWFMKAAKQDHVKAQILLVYCYKNGLGIEKNEKEASKWFMKARGQGGDIEAQSIIDHDNNSENLKNEKSLQQDDTKIQNEIDLDSYIEKYIPRIERCIRETTKQEMSGYKIKKEQDNDTNMKAKENQDFSKVFIVHGRDEGLKHKIARLLDDQDIKPIILDEQLNEGAETIIKKFEENSNVGAAICLFTADDIGKLKDKYSEKEKTKNDLKPRARQNVVFETGFFMAKLGRKNVIIIADPEIEFPSDMGNILYTNSEEWRIDMLSELDNMGYEIDLNKLKKKKTL